jgi:hypothetical protein
MELARPHLAPTGGGGQLPKNKAGKLKKRKVNMKKILLLLTAALGLAMSVKAGTPDEDYKANIPKTKAVDEELKKAEAALLLSHGERASWIQLETAIAHVQTDIDRQNAILHRGIDQCLAAGPKFYKEHIGFWTQLASLLRATQLELNEIKASTQKQLAQSQ